MRTSLALLLASVTLASPARADLLVGVAEADVTPEVGTPLAGYGARLRRGLPDLDPRTPRTLFEPSSGVRDPIEAQALVLERAGLVVALVTIDAIGVEDLLVADLLEAARGAGVPLSDGGLFVAASHTHSGPGALSRRTLWAVAACDVFSRRVHRGFVSRGADLLRRAWASRRPARVGWGQVEVPGVTRNRRAGRSTRVTEDDVDPTARALRVDDARTGQRVAVVMHLAVHGTCLGPDNARFSADVPGALRRAVAARVGCPTLFVNGCEGDVAPRPGGERGLEEVPAKVAPAVEALVRSLETRPDLPLAVAERRRDLGHLVVHPGLGDSGELDDAGAAEGVARLVARTLSRAPGGALDGLVSTRFRFAALRLGDLVLLAVPGEPIVELGRELEAQARALGLRPWVLGLANGHMGYIATAEEYAEGGYEAWLTLYGPETAADVQEAFGEVLEELAPR